MIKRLSVGYLKNIESFKKVVTSHVPLSGILVLSSLLNSAESCVLIGSVGMARRLGVVLIKLAGVTLRHAAQQAM